MGWVAESIMLLRLKRETAVHHATADNDRLSILGASAEATTYSAFLSRIFGFESPIESALAMIEGLDELVDLRARSHIRLLRADLQALGTIDASQLQRCSMASPPRQAPEALGWMYTVERNTLSHGVIERHLRSRLPAVMRVAGSYLSAQTKSTGARFRELGVAMDRVANSPAIAERIVNAARTAFRCQHG